MKRNETQRDAEGMELERRLERRQWRMVRSQRRSRNPTKRVAPATLQAVAISVQRGLHWHCRRAHSSPPSFASRASRRARTDAIDFSTYFEMTSTSKLTGSPTFFFGMIIFCCVYATSMKLNQPSV